jgi:hypothetical protein
MVSLACIAAMASRHKVSQYMRAALGSRNEVINDDAISATAVTAVAIECCKLIKHRFTTQSHVVILSILNLGLVISLAHMAIELWIAHVPPSECLGRPVALISNLSIWIFFPIPALLKVYQFRD